MPLPNFTVGNEKSQLSEVVVGAQPGVDDSGTGAGKSQLVSASNAPTASKRKGDRVQVDLPFTDEAGSGADRG